jgi:peptidylprolyl isomerase
VHIRVLLPVVALLSLAAAVPAQEPEPGPKVTTTQSGIEITVLEEGASNDRPVPGEVVRVHYTGWLEDGTKFDSSRDREQPFEFPVGRRRVIRGWDEVLQLMDVGDKIRVKIPAALAYGADRRGMIPPNSNLVFEIELLSIVRPPAFPKAKPERQKKLPSGLVYEVVKEGEGEAPRMDQGVRIRFAFWSASGGFLASSETLKAHLAGIAGTLQLTRKQEPFLKEVVPLLKAGTVLRLEVPAALCWGDEPPVPGLEPGTTTVWELELVGVQDVPAFVKVADMTLARTDSGLMYQILAEGQGDSPGAGSTVTVRYTGWFEDGSVFDSSHARGEPTTFQVRQVIPGWQEGLRMMKPGATYRFVIPAGLAYGDKPPPGIPENATLIFLVELISAS